MQLRRFRVRNFRSVRDSGWVHCDEVTTLVGINEAGKSNLLLALWKLKPARDGEIDLLSDIPRALYSSLRDAEEKPVFIEAEFELSAGLIARLKDLTNADSEDLAVATVSRRYDGNYVVGFPAAKTIATLPVSELRTPLEKALVELEGLSEAGKGEAGIKDRTRAVLQGALEDLQEEHLTSKAVEQTIRSLKDLKSPLQSSKILPLVKQLVGLLEDSQARLDRPHPVTNAEARALVIQELPSFVYYSNYGNLDGEIYLPHVIENLNRTDLTGTAATKTRTLRILFEFVGLDPSEILEKGQEPQGPFDNRTNRHGPPSAEQIARAAEDKRERDVLLHSASTRLTEDFRAWWRQGRYEFDLAADGNHFRIWVSDEERPAKVELEHRSTGLQWFLSFFLVFLVESQEAHKGAILLLDEAGLSLHPLAQQDLAAFFENLSKTNQIVHSTHSPFLINTDHVDRVKVVYVDDAGHTVASDNLRAGEGDPRQSKSVYAVHAALGLSVSQSLLQGCHPVIVEGPSDQYYLSAIKTFLLSQGHLMPSREIVFAPAGGVRGVTGVAGILSAKEEELPFVLVDSDKMGRDIKQKLVSGLYSGLEDRIIEVSDILDLPDAEVEDLLPGQLILPVISRIFRSVDEEIFEDVVVPDRALVPQVKEFAERHKVALEDGWKVDVARQVKARLLQRGVQLVDEETVSRWKALLEALYPGSTSTEEDADATGA